KYFKFKYMNELETRMYFFVPYNISEIQKGIQAGHCALEYAYEHGYTDLYKRFINKDKTWIILNGGTTNNNFVLGTGEPVGSLNKTHYLLRNNVINIAFFKEPDLNDALTAVCFLADERVYNYKNYPDFKEWIIENSNHNKDEITILEYDTLIYKYKAHYLKWVELLGGEKNVFLRDLIRNKKLA
nr:hypothetical protein [Bacteroidales bacterium]